jgi:hypothetical protein
MEMADIDNSGPATTGQTGLPVIPTERDRENARMREEIAARQEADYVECYCWALGTFGPGWIPSHRHYLIEKDEEERARRSGDKPTPAATVFTARTAEGNQRHFMVEDGCVSATL